MAWEKADLASCQACIVLRFSDLKPHHTNSTSWQANQPCPGGGRSSGSSRQQQCSLEAVGAALLVLAECVWLLVRLVVDQLLQSGSEGAWVQCIGKR